MLKDLEKAVVGELRGMKAADVRPKFLHEMLRLLHAVLTDCPDANKAEAKAVLEDFRERIVRWKA
jgi:hypothetical protein